MSTFYIRTVFGSILFFQVLLSILLQWDRKMGF